MIGNDVIDLALANKESNWQRKGFLDKIFTQKEQILIENSNNKETIVWNLWSRKEAAYKIWNRANGVRSFNPSKFECLDFTTTNGRVKFENNLYFTKTEINSHFIHTVAVTKLDDFYKIKQLEDNSLIIKKDKFPYFVDANKNEIPLSKSHHGAFQKVVFLDYS